MRTNEKLIKKVGEIIKKENKKTIISSLKTVMMLFRKSWPLRSTSSISITTRRMRNKGSFRNFG